jgi:acyl carrier protein
VTSDDLKVFLAATLQIKSVDENAEMGRTRGWDSIRQVQLMLALEERCNVSIPADAFGELTSFSNIAAFLRDEAVLVDG